MLLLSSSCCFYSSIFFIMPTITRSKAITDKRLARRIEKKSSSAVRNSSACVHCVQMNFRRLMSTDSTRCPSCESPRASEKIRSEVTKARESLHQVIRLHSALDCEISSNDVGDVVQQLYFPSYSDGHRCGKRHRPRRT